MRSTRVKWVIALAVVTSAVWLVGLMYVISYKPEVHINPGTVATSVPAIYSPNSNPIKVYTPLRARSHHFTYSPTLRTTHMPSASMHSTGGLFLTSKAQVHSVGGGNGNTNGVYTTSHGNTSNRGIQYSTASATMPQTNFLAVASSRQMADPQAANAPQMAKLASGPNHAPGPPNPTGPLDPNNQLVEHAPIGDALIPLLLFALAFGAYRLIRNKNIRLV